MISGHTTCPCCKRRLIFYFYDLLYDNPDIHGNKKCYIVCFCKHRINIEDPLPLFLSRKP